MPEFADWLWSQVKKPVVDRTELRGTYDFYLEHGRELAAPRLQPDGGIAASDPTGPDLLAAIQTQLGLKLTSGQGDVEVLVIERLDRVLSGNWEALSAFRAGSQWHRRSRADASLSLIFLRIPLRMCRPSWSPSPKRYRWQWCPPNS
jgi:hypothetical protein